eukprot:TRINITY_DN8258_c0_g1_i4.p1 TRINITY_DN8258_c0_g1~~TRINITY_DN8258_c0_g1_i4.p1  ORF type:complete len:133 (-),score=25.35 TRINITY_DN8258_c0_g1_i4:45-443(-)
MQHTFSSTPNNSTKTFHVLKKIMFSDRRSHHGHQFHVHERAQSQHGNDGTFSAAARLILNDKPSSSEDSACSCPVHKEEKQTALCKVCCTREVAIAFIPCGHTAVCTKCSERLKNCPYCKREIRGKLRIYFL